jgi:hypothetical protein
MIQKKTVGIYHEPHSDAPLTTTNETGDSDGEADIDRKIIPSLVYRKELLETVDSLFEDFDQLVNHAENTMPQVYATVAFYVHDPVILNFFYTRYPHNRVPSKAKVVVLHPHFEE